MAPKDVIATRRARLKAHIDRHHGGIQARVVEAIDINQGELSGLLNGKKPFGEKKARRLEHQLGMEEGELDIPLPSVPPVAKQQGPTYKTASERAAVSAPIIPALSDEELLLLDLFRSRSASQRRAILALVASMQPTRRTPPAIARGKATVSER